ncbi:MAG: four helix bundle protein [Prevotella sp.]
MSRDNLIDKRCYTLALRIVRLCKYLNQQCSEYTLSKQVLRSGTSVGAQMREAKFAQSRADFVNKSSIALKEANETIYWLDLLHDSGYINDEMFASIHKDAEEILSILVKIVKTTKINSAKYSSLRVGAPDFCCEDIISEILEE